MGLYSALPFVLGTFSNVAGGYLSDWAAKKIGLRLGRRIIGTACLALSAILLAGAGLSGDKVSVVLLLSLSFGVMDLMLPSAWAVCLDVGHKYAGAISGAMNTAGNLGGFLCTVLFGYIVKMSNNNYNVPLFVIAAMLMISSLLFSRIDSSHPLAAEEVKTE
jgi:MFS family permease